MIDARGATAVAIADAVRSGKVRAREITDQYLDRVAPPGRAARVLSGGRRGRGATACRCHRRRGKGRPRSGTAGRRSARHQGHLLHARHRDHLRLEDPARVRASLRIDGHRAAGGGRGGRPRQAQHGRVRHGLVHRGERVQARSQSLVDGARSGRLLRRLGGRGRRFALRRGDRNRYRRVDPATCGSVRGGRA